MVAYGRECPVPTQQNAAGHLEAQSGSSDTVDFGIDQGWPLKHPLQILCIEGWIPAHQMLIGGTRDDSVMTAVVSSWIHSLMTL